MIETQTWVSEVLVRLQKAFGTRLAYLGLQGSYRRGEATEASDIDLVVLLDKVDMDDLDTYRALVHAMPEGAKACGFISGIGELAHWPKHELFPFKMDTDDYYSVLDDFLPLITEEHIREGARIGASALLHMLTHSYLYADAVAQPTILRDAYKAAYFVMQVTHYLTTGRYCTSYRELLACVEGVEKDILVARGDMADWLGNHSEKQAYGILRDWCQRILTQD